jgi:hypothetical protein
VTALAIDPFRNSAAQSKFGRLAIPARVSIVTEEAFPIQLPPKIHVIGPVVSRIHRPPSTLLAIPRNRQLDELTVLSLMQICTRVITRAEDEVDLHFEYVSLTAVAACLVTPLVEMAAALVHSEILV